MYLFMEEYTEIMNGYQNERDIVTRLNNQLIKDLPAHFQHWLRILFIDHSSPLKVIKLNNEQKADIAIRCGSKTIYVSIKSGEGNSFHSEQIHTFIPFLRSIGVSESTLKTMVFFHYGDNTLNGTGRTRFTSAELRRKHSKYFNKASKELSNYHVIRHLISRCVVKGRYPNNFSIDGIYHGTINDGFFLPIDMIYKILLCNSNIRKNGTINMKMLTYQPGSRNLWGIPGTEQKRHNCEVKWRSFTKDALNHLRFSR